MKILIFLMFFSCASPSKKLQQDKKCLDAVSGKKIIAPKGVSSFGAFSNVKKIQDYYDGYKVRIVKRRGYCQALILEFSNSLEPQTYAISNLFECSKPQNIISLVSKVGFTSPYSENTPQDFYFGLEARINAEKNLEGYISFPRNDLMDRPEKTKVLLSRLPKDQASMAAFDWEIIQRLNMKKSCYF